ncbi:ARPP-1 family domain-containing protein [Actinomadura litoris]|uniref:ARPP-1 family domain-containing protein n=1 Tax=Actinomadura litoris TaxID=2678616 RepID=UPI0023430727|nr:DUF6569 family protein [Actinomadura litoris]
MTDLTALDTLVPGPLSLAGHRLGTPQQAGALIMVPISEPAHPGFTPPHTLRPSRATGRGQVELTNPDADGVAIVPLHIGHLQDRAPTRALCRSALIPPGRTLRFEDACCVQEGRSGHLTGGDPRFLVLPGELRARALALRGVTDHGKLSDAIADLNARHGLARRGHLDPLLARHRPALARFQNRLEPQPGQVGALFLIAGRLAGVEITPDPAYFAQMWTALACHAYGVAAHRAEPAPPAPAEPYDAANLAELRGALDHDRSTRLAHLSEQITAQLTGPATGPVRLREEDRHQTLRLSTLTAPHLAGQIVTDGDRAVYASLFARRFPPDPAIP